MALEPAFIVAQYKCGTSWLLAALCAHPEILGLREIDIIRSVCADRGRVFEAADPEQRTEAIFNGSAWSSKRRVNKALQQDSGGKFIPLDRPQIVHGVDHRVLRRLVTLVRNPEASAVQILDGFVEAVSTSAEDERLLMLKGADQVMAFDTLRQWQPDAPAVAITRDGRDATLSAVAYRALMIETNKRWIKDQDELEFDDLIAGWAIRARRLVELAQAGEVYLIRYEDLTSNFVQTLTGVLEAIGVTAAPGTVEKIEAATDFEHMTGRKRGVPGQHILRGGMVDEWRSKLKPQHQDQIWQSHGDTLSLLGYRKEEGIDPLRQAGWKAPQWQQN